jgi:outer membrane cobalamin receptor
LKYDAKVSDRLTITPQFVHYNQTPWAYGDEGTREYVYKVKALRNLGSLTLNQSIGRKLNLTYGGMLFADRATSSLHPDAFAGRKLEMTNYAGFAQGLYKHRLFNVTAGFRYEHNSKAGGAFVPRLAFTKKIENFHFKILYSEAFRTPSIENINLAPHNPNNPNGKVTPEKSRVGELEFGYQFTPDMLLSLNAFSINTRKVIIYRYDGVLDIDWYENFKKTGSKGVELIYSVQQKRWNARLTYTYTASQKTDSSTYYVPQTKTSYMGFPKHKVVLVSSIDLTKKLSLNPTLVASGNRYAYTKLDADGNPVSNKLPGYVLLNIFFNYSNLVPGLNAGLGVYDLLNERPGIPQPYNGGYLPIPCRSREFVVKLSYQFNFKGQ